MNTQPTNNPTQPHKLLGETFGGRQRRRGKRRPARYRVPSPGDFLRALVPFTDGSGGKIRSVLMLKAERLDFIVAPVTGDEPEEEFEVAIRYWQAAGMSRPGTVRCARICAVDRKVVFEVLGRILPEDLGRVMTNAKAWFASVEASATALDQGSFLVEDQDRRVVRYPSPNGDDRVLSADRFAA